MKAKRQIESSLNSVTMLDGTGGSHTVDKILTKFSPSERNQCVPVFEVPS